MAIVFLIFWFMHNLTMVNIRKNGVKISAEQFPDFYAKALAVAEQMNLNIVPDIYIMQSGGILNAFATKFGMKNMVVLYSDVFSLIEEQGEQEVLYILAHEFAHVKRKHVGLGWILMPGLAYPFLGKAYSRACEITCDRYGAYYSQSYEGAKNALTILAIGPLLYKRVDQSTFMHQVESEDGVFSWIDEIMSTHPNLPKRIYELNRFFNIDETPEIKTSKKGLVLGLGILILGFFLLVFGSAWILTQIEEEAEAAEAAEEAKTKTEEETGFSYDLGSMNNLMIAVINQDMDSVKSYSAKLNINDTNSEGYTALHVAVMWGNYEAAKYLLEAGANPNTMDVYEYTPLMDAVGYEDYNMVELLLSSGADKTIKDSNGYDAYQFAIDYGFEDISNLINNK